MRMESERLGVTGWVRNRIDDTVETMDQSPPEAVEKIIRWTHRSPDAAFVAEVQVTEGFGEYHHFEKRRGERREFWTLTAYGLSLEQTARVIGQSVGWTCRLRNRFLADERSRRTNATPRAIR